MTDVSDQKAAAYGAQRRPIHVEDYWKLCRIADVQTSTTGDMAYVVRSVSRERNERRAAIWLLTANDPNPRALSGSTTVDETPRWSPDGRLLATISAPSHADPRRLCVLDPQTRERRELTSGGLTVSSPAWSPSGDTLCFVQDEPAADLHVEAEWAWYAARGEVPRSATLQRLTSLRSRVDGAGYRERRAQLVTLPITSTATPRPLAPSAFDDIDPAWSPDGRWIAFVSNRTADPRLFSEQNIWIVDVASGELRQLTHGYWLCGPLVWSPDSTLVASVGAAGLHVPFSLRLWLVAADGSGAVAATPGFGAHLWPMAPRWTASGDRVLIAGGIGNAGELLSYDLPSRTTEVAVRADAILGGLALLPDEDRFVALASSPESPSLLVTGSLAGGTLTTLVDVNARWLCELSIAPTRRVSFTSPDGFAIDGWLVSPTAKAAPFPCVLDVHYGPNAAWGPAFAFGAQALAGNGIATLFLNPRGSTGYGDAFAAAADYGVNDYADLLLGLDTLVAQAVIDGDRLGIMGLSYGGFMANWAITQTQRFAAAVSINGISNQLTWYLLSDTGLFFYQDRFGDPFASEAAMETYWRHSPLAHIADVETPLLLLHSEGDYRCPIDQSEQMFGALVARGKRVEMIRFPNAAHDLMGTASPLHAYLALRLTIECSIAS